MSSDIGMYGLGVMGENLVMNLAEHGFRVSVTNLWTEAVDSFSSGRGKGKCLPCYTVEEFVASLAIPRKIFMMIKAGSPVDETIERLLPLLSPGDILIDGGNSHYKDTLRRLARVEAAGLLYVGSGVSGGELGALRGPSLMPGGSAAAWDAIAPIFTAISAKVQPGDQPCCSWMGSGGAGHYVKMVHNGIEYGDMQLICECYDLMRKLTGSNAQALSMVFDEWSRGPLASYLIEITRDILATKEADGGALVDRILDVAMQKGTGKWASQEALERQIPLSLITEAVYARMLSGCKEERQQAAALAVHPLQPSIPLSSLAPLLEQALYAAKVISYAQGFSLMRMASEQYHWELHYGEIAKIWRGGCIIRSSFLGSIADAFSKEAGLVNLMLDDYFAERLAAAIPALRQVVSMGALGGVPLPAISAALAYYDGYHSQQLPANLLQAQRDYFGAHMVERTDAPRGEFFHYNWSGEGGDTASTVYER
ncbi:MAG: decarboxylating NADP(+)-dependent phosphogluconate dehydrogenase [Angelakisella sp.]